MSSPEEEKAAGSERLTTPLAELKTPSERRAEEIVKEAGLWPRGQVGRKLVPLIAGELRKREPEPEHLRSAYLASWSADRASLCELERARLEAGIELARMRVAGATPATRFLERLAAHAGGLVDQLADKAGLDSTLLPSEEPFPLEAVTGAGDVTEEQVERLAQLEHNVIEAVEQLMAIDGNVLAEVGVNVVGEGVRPDGPQRLEPLAVAIAFLRLKLRDLQEAARALP